MPDRTIETQYIFGRNPVVEAIDAGTPINRILLAHNQTEKFVRFIKLIAGKRDIPVQVLSSAKLNALVASTDRHQGVVAEISSFKYWDIDRFLLEKSKAAMRIIILDQIEDPHNLGAICRSAEAAGYDAMIIPAAGAAQVNATVVKTSAGAVFHIPVVRLESIDLAVEILQGAGFSIIAAAAKNGDNFAQTQTPDKFAIIIGSEGRGVRKHILEKADQIVTIPMQGKINSLNASVSAGILLFGLGNQ
jgi:23S rRNA (guanosine2251-2'-O)-methyltransferase